MVKKSKRKVDKDMRKILNNISTIILAFLITFFAGRFSYQLYSKGEVQLNENTVVKI